MKRIDIFCSSQAATAIHLGMDEGSSSSSSSSLSSIHLGNSNSPAIDRHNPIITDSRRTTKPLPPKPNNNQHRKNRKGTNSKSKDEKKKKICLPEQSDGGVIKKGWSCTKPGDFISPPTSSRYLLGDAGFLDVLSDFDPVLKLVQVETTKSQGVKSVESSDSNPPSSSRSPDQVVVLKVSLHCRGCERKMRKHISRMEGVTSFNIDFAAKKVTVVGDVTPLGVLSSVSKVKNAQLWTPTIVSSVPTVISSTSEVVKEYNDVGKEEKMEIFSRVVCE